MKCDFLFVPCFLRFYQLIHQVCRQKISTVLVVNLDTTRRLKWMIRSPPDVIGILNNSLQPCRPAGKRGQATNEPYDLNEKVWSFDLFTWAHESVDKNCGNVLLKVSHTCSTKLCRRRHLNPAHGYLFPHLDLTFGCAERVRKRSFLTIKCQLHDVSLSNNRSTPSLPRQIYSVFLHMSWLGHIMSS